MIRYAGLALFAALVSIGAAVAAEPSRLTGDTPEAQRTTRALNILEAQGLAAGLQDKSLSAFHDFHEQGKDFVATILQNGRLVVVIVDPDTGQVTHRN